MHFVYEIIRRVRARFEKNKNLGTNENQSRRCKTLLRYVHVITRY